MTGKETETAMSHQNHTHQPDPDRSGGRRARSRWWAVGVTGLALTTASVAAAPAADAVGRNRTTVADRPSTDEHRGKLERPQSHVLHGRPSGKPSDQSREEPERKGGKSPGVPVPCDPDALIAAITLANARGGGVLDLAPDCTYLLTANIDGAGLPAITTPITLNGSKHTTIERAAAADQFRILTVNTGGNLTLNQLTVTGGQTTGAGADGAGILVEAGGALTTSHSTITRNIASAAGGGIANNGTTHLRSSTVAAAIPPPPSGEASETPAYSTSVSPTSTPTPPWWEPESAVRELFGSNTAASPKIAPEKPPAAFSSSVAAPPSRTVALRTTSPRRWSAASSRA